MTWRGMILVVLALALAGCFGETPPPALVAPDPCPASASAALEPAPERPALDEQQQAAVDVAMVVALGEPLAVALIRFHDAELPAYVGRLQMRVEQTRTWCEGRADEPDA